MTQIIFNSSREPLALTQKWPETPVAPHGSLLWDKYYKERNKVIASAVPFKLDEDKAKIKLAIASKVAKNEHKFCSWQPEVNKPYDVPEELEVEIHEVLEAPDQNKSLLDRNEFAFLKQQPKEQIKVESQDELWDEIFDMVNMNNTWPGGQYIFKQDVKSRFKISRR